MPVDLTRPEDGFDDSHYGGEALKRVLLQVLPTAYRQTLITLEEASHELKNLYLRQAMPHIVGYSVLAGTAGAVPIPWVDLLILPGIQTRMVHQLAHLYGQPQAGARFLELASTLGLGMLARQSVPSPARCWPALPHMPLERHSAITSLPSIKGTCRPPRNCGIITRNSSRRRSGAGR